MNCGIANIFDHLHILLRHAALLLLAWHTGETSWKCHNESGDGWSIKLTLSIDGNVLHVLVKGRRRRGKLSDQDAPKCLSEIDPKTSMIARPLDFHNFSGTSITASRTRTASSSVPLVNQSTRQFLITMSHTRALSSAFRRATQQRVPQYLPRSRYFSLLACRHHEAQIKMRKDAIRQRIQDFELSRRRFSQSAVQQHGHLDPPKPGEEYVGSMQSF